MRRIEANMKLSLGRLQAFTLVELLVVVAIIAVAGGVGIGLYGGTSERFRLEKAARNFLITAKYARIMAIEKQREYKIQLDTENGGFTLSSIEWNESAEEFEQTVVNDYYCKPFEFEGNVMFEDVKVAPDYQTEESDEEAEASIVFRPDGSADPVVVQIGNGRTHYTISISPATGKAKIHFGELDSAEIGTIDLDAES